MDKSKFLNVAMAVGKVAFKPLPDRARVHVQLNRFNPILKMYFPEVGTLNIFDSKRQAKVGDIVLLKKMETPRFDIDSHEISEVLFTAGAIVDPITGLRVEGHRYLFDEKPLSVEELNKLNEDIQSREVAPKYSYEVSDKYIKREAPRRKK